MNGDSAKRLVYKMSLNEPEKTECFSCYVREDCAFGTAYFSKECAYAVLTCKGPSVPQFNIYNKASYSQYSCSILAYIHTIDYYWRHFDIKFEDNPLSLQNCLMPICKKAL